MKLLKRMLIKIVIYIVIFMIIMSDFASCFAYSQEEVGNAIAGFAAHVVKDCGNKICYRQITGDKYDVTSNGGETNHCRTDNPIWSPSNYTWDSEYIYFDCSSFASGCYNYVAGLFDSAQSTGSLDGFSSSDFERGTLSSSSEAKIGDLIWNPEHAIIFIGDSVSGISYNFAEVGPGTGEWGEHCGFRDLDNYIAQKGYAFNYLRVSSSGASKITSLNTEFSLTGTKNGSSGTSIDYSKFFFNGVPDGKYSLASRKSILEIIVDAIENIFSFIVGLIAYIFRVIAISIVSIFDRLLNNMVKNIVEPAETSLQESGLSSTSADDPESENRTITIQSMVFNTLDIFDVNFFEEK
jgi:hypothetical protein